MQARPPREGGAPARIATHPRHNATIYNGTTQRLEAPVSPSPRHALIQPSVYPIDKGRPRSTLPIDVAIFKIVSSPAD